MAPTIDGLNWADLACAMLICSGAIMIGIWLIDRLFPAQGRGTPTRRNYYRGEGSDRPNGEGGVALDQEPAARRIARTKPPTYIAGPSDAVMHGRQLKGDMSMASVATSVRSNVDTRGIWKVIDVYKRQPTG